MLPEGIWVAQKSRAWAGAAARVLNLELFDEPFALSSCEETRHNGELEWQTWRDTTQEVRCGDSHARCLSLWTKSARARFIVHGRDALAKRDARRVASHGKAERAATSGKWAQTN